jgi:hypothetical protein
MMIRGLCAVGVVLVAVVTLGMAACGGPTPSPNSGVRGVMTEVGGPPPGSPRPMPNVRIEVHRGDNGGPVVAVVKSSSDGTFSVALPPDRYAVVPLAGGDELVIPASVTVRPEKWAHVDVRFSVR